MRPSAARVPVRPSGLDTLSRNHTRCGWDQKPSIDVLPIPSSHDVFMEGGKVAPLAGIRRLCLISRLAMDYSRLRRCSRIYDGDNPVFTCSVFATSMPLEITPFLARFDKKGAAPRRLSCRIYNHGLHTNQSIALKNLSTAVLPYLRRSGTLRGFSPTIFSGSITPFSPSSSRALASIHSLIISPVTSRWNCTP